MKVNNSNLLKVLGEFKKNVDECENCYYLIFSAYKQLELNWNDPYSQSFIDNIDREKKQFDMLLEILKKIHNILLNTYKNYKKIGQKLFFQEDDYGNVANIYDNILTGYTKFKKVYNTVPKEKLNDIFLKDSISKIYDKIDMTKDDIAKAKKRYDEIYNEINNNEKLIYKKLSKISIVKIDSIDFNGLTKNPNLTGKIGFFKDYQEIVLKLSSLIDEEAKIQRLIDTDFIELSSCYKTNSYKKIELLKEDIKNALFVINNNHINSLKFLNNRINNISDITLKAKYDIKNIGDNLGN